MRPRGDDGSAIVEFVFVAVIVLVPIVYAVVAVAAVQRSQLAVSQAARDAGRAFATSDGESLALQRVRVVVRLAMTGQQLHDEPEIRFVAADAACTSAPVAPRLTAGARFAVCVTRHVELPAVPTVLEGRGITSVGRYVVHVDDFRVISP